MLKINVLLRKCVTPFGREMCRCAEYGGFAEGAHSVEDCSLPEGHHIAN